jgi:uncharacterized protein YcbX
MLFFYAGMRVAAWPISPSGLCFDRMWAVTDRHGKALTQKSYPQLALVRPEIDLESKTMLVRAAGMEDVLRISLEFPSASTDQYFPSEDDKKEGNCDGTFR